MSDAPTLPTRVRIVEVGPRDGLQNETKPVSLQDKLSLIARLVDSGLRSIEAGSFVNPAWVPQMAGSDELFQRLLSVSTIIDVAFCSLFKG
jgi:hydroxymethylglutaryl-CoA lyase